MPKTNISFSENDIKLLSFSYRSIVSWRYGNLSLPYWKIIHNKNGISEVFFKKNISQRRISLPESNIILIPPKVDFSCNSSSPIFHFNINFIISGINLSVKKSFFSFTYEEVLKGLIDEILLNEQFHSQSCKKLVLFLLNQIPESSYSPLVNDIRIDTSISHMKHSLNKPLSNLDLAEEASMSVNGFARLFRDLIGQTPYEYQSFLRIDKACNLLQFSKDSIESIANECGFTNRFHFSKSFKKNKILTPVEYRKLVQKI
ncbi:MULTISPECIES: AraC family transcriptional regulator [unclassified Oceanispirochaeta]|uniref:helix-turn-helix domain-containing protein n=1 Tax=unclassified Oceanispirochaeta TaxID=2635722 RepID=UPI000E0945D3|nr:MULTISPECIES: AraC family transcriptional regulator [unclassified Oceanispirochaeta]MBF9018975.1 helix-turn-helix transcriptional regulator [Oceanispirochaeta sp. M2]NPD75475.1 helix-turn-helix transcriptional regulator [Oceanispirochaeta sp. M1]RDG28667.1 AraC family transcriptional regulator [Oceanispirochaeta sp. M1]